MIKLLSIFGLFLFIVGCSTTAVSPQNQLAVIETWSGYANGRGAQCPDADVKVQILEDFSIIGKAYTTERNLIIHLRGKIDPNRNFLASGSGFGGATVTYKGSINGNSGSGTWDSSLSVHRCEGTWELSKISL